MASIQTTAGGMPVLILKEGTKENKGKEAQRNNITAAWIRCLLTHWVMLQLQMMVQQY
jgi:hypothetical protein